MPVLIGAKPESNFQDPIGLLTDCHRRIERFLAVLVRIAGEVRGGSLDDEQRRSLETALRYFREAAPKHTADEEETLFPRMRKIHRPDVQDVMQRIESLEQDHCTANERHAEVDRLGRRWLGENSLPEMDSTRLSVILEELSLLYRDHIALEEREVFPAAAAMLSAAEREEAGKEMALRRGLER